MPDERKNPITPDGYRRLQADYRELMEVERPKVVDIVSWAAGNGDRSENGDYIYGRMKLRDIDRQLRHLSRRMKTARIIDPLKHGESDRILFGATVELADEDDERRVVTLVGDDEADASQGRIGWGSPLARALRGARVNDVRTVQLPAGAKQWEILSIQY